MSAEEEWDVDSLDLDAYLRRIGHEGPRTATAATLTAVHRAHKESVGFGNVDVFLGREVPLGTRDLQRKLVDARRGGYCFEHNLLFAAALERLGFRVTRLLARVRQGRPTVRYRAHTVLLVTLGDTRMLADVGFGDEGLIEPIPLVAGARAEVGKWSWQVAAEGDQWVLRSLHDEGWFDLYAFREEHHHFVDFEVSHHYTAHSPRSTFVGKLIAMRGTEERRSLLRGLEFTTRSPGGPTERVKLTPEELPRVLLETFLIELSAEEKNSLRLLFAAS
ncbi:arylamine N-acetyltransferase [Streptomyces sp. NPDC085612]|uniref:arylamine N-acetyltransferase n=1 Tax=Streptomyces sp. NPDC085612 TaxID=3365732 RepID=UPI0037D85274